MNKQAKILLILVNLLLLLARMQVWAQQTPSAWEAKPVTSLTSDEIQQQWRYRAKQSENTGFGPKDVVTTNSFQKDAHRGVQAFSFNKSCTGACHEGLANNVHSKRFDISCVRCHDDKPIVGLQNTNSNLYKSKRASYNCSSCHGQTTAAFASFLIHEPFPLLMSTKDQFPALWYMVWFMVILAGGVFLFFVPFTILNVVKSWFNKATSHESFKEKIYIQRFSLSQRLWHLALAISFMTLAVTGCIWLVIDTQAGQNIAQAIGGYKVVLNIHWYMGVILLMGFAIHILLSLRHLFVTSKKDRLTLGFSDIAGFFSHLAWSLGLKKQYPNFERWIWYQKFDYWAIWWGFIITGVTGIMLKYPEESAIFLPGWTLNIALWLHRIEAILAIGHIVMVHFIFENMRKNTFPFNEAMVHGVVELEELEKEHPKWIQRLKESGMLKGYYVNKPSAILRIIGWIIGWVIILIGIILLIFVVANIGKTLFFQ